MRRIVVVLLSVVALFGTLLVGSGAFVAAQDPASTDFTGHPLVGTWLLDTDTDDPENPPEVAIFTADGGYASVEAVGFPSLGVGEATGDNTATLTITSASTDDTGTYEGTFIVRAAIEADPSGDAFTAQYTFEVTDSEGNGTGQFGPGNAAATRLTPEPMGTPVGPASELFEQFEGTPEATPVP